MPLLLIISQTVLASAGLLSVASVFLVELVQHPIADLSIHENVIWVDKRLLNGLQAMAPGRISAHEFLHAGMALSIEKMPHAICRPAMRVFHKKTPQGIISDAAVKTNDCLSNVPCCMFHVFLRIGCLMVVLLASCTCGIP